MGDQKKPAPKEGGYRRDRGHKNQRTGKSEGGSVAGRITRKLWGKITGWDNPGRG